MLVFWNRILRCYINITTNITITININNINITTTSVTTWWYFMTFTLSSLPDRSGNTYRVSSLVAQRIKHLPVMWETQVWSLGWKDPLEKEMQRTPVLLPGESHGQRSLAGYSPWGSPRVGHDWATSTSLHRVLAA